MNGRTRVCAAILAAGQSSRLGSPKQLLPFAGKTLLQHVVTEACHSECTDVLTVLGAHHADIADATSFERSTVLINDHWADGISTSIVQAVQHLNVLPQPPNAVLFLVADQPFVSTELIDSIVHKFFHSKKSIVCCRYSGVFGVPALFSRELFVELQALTGDTGARKVLNTHQDMIEAIDFTEGSYDIDTEDDLIEVLNLEHL